MSAGNQCSWQVQTRWTGMWWRNQTKPYTPVLQVRGLSMRPVISPRDPPKGDSGCRKLTCYGTSLQIKRIKSTQGPKAVWCQSMKSSGESRDREVKSQKNTLIDPKYTTIKWEASEKKKKQLSSRYPKENTDKGRHQIP